MSYESSYHLLKTQLEGAQDEADELRGELETQEANAKNGGRIDWIWIAQSKTELRTRNRKVQRLNQEVAGLKREYLQQQNASLEKCFMDICRKELPIEAFNRFLESAKVISADVKPQQNYGGFDAL